MYPWMQATIDRGLNDDGILEIKTSNPYAASKYANGGVPTQYLIQIQHQMAVTGATFAYLACLVDGSKLIVRKVERNDEFIDALIAVELEFWEYVQSGTEPDIDGSEHTKRALAEIHPKSNGESIVLPFEMQDADTRREEIAAEMKELKKEKDEIDNKIRAALGDNEIGMIPGARYSLTDTTRKATHKLAFLDGIDPEGEIARAAIESVRAYMAEMSDDGMTLETTPAKTTRTLRRKALKG
jgi:predicted phage-related endonuclease